MAEKKRSNKELLSPSMEQTFGNASKKQDSSKEATKFGSLSGKQATNVCNAGSNKDKDTAAKTPSTSYNEWRPLPTWYSAGKNGKPDMYYGPSLRMHAPSTSSTTEQAEKEKLAKEQRNKLRSYEKSPFDKDDNNNNN